MINAATLLHLAFILLSIRTPLLTYRTTSQRYAIENYSLCAQSLKPGSTTVFVNTNFPPGYVYEGWDAQKILKDAAEGKKIQVSGDWS